MKNLSQHWQSIQGKLFPWLEEEVGPLSEKQQQLVTVLEFARVEQFIPYWHGSVWCPLEDRRTLARAYVAKAVYNMPTTVTLIERLQNDKSLRRLCGWERRDEIPSESTFSRAFAEFAISALPSRVHEALIKTYRAEMLVGHISRDSTAIEARERVCSEAKIKAKEKKAIEKAKKEAKLKAKRGRPKQGEERTPKEQTRLEKQLTMTVQEMLKDLPKGCDIGTKRNSKGHQGTSRELERLFPSHRYG